MNRFYVIGAASLGLALLAALHGKAGLAQGVALANETTLYTFQGGSDGGSPFGGLIVVDGDLYGTTFTGTYHGIFQLDFGTVFRLTASGAKTVLYTFQGGKDGANPQAGVIDGGKGVLYGATAGGGSSACGFTGTPPGTTGCGTIYELIPQGSGYQERVIYAFQGGNDGFAPIGPLILGQNGTLYGTTSEGGDTNCTPPGNFGLVGCGTVFELTPNGADYAEHILYRFKGGSDGIGPRGRLTIADNGAIYGTTWQGGSDACPNSCGTVFQITPSGDESIVYRFKGGTTDGYAPRSAVIIRKDGALIGLATKGGIGGPSLPPNTPAGYGIAYALTPSNTGYTEHVLYFFKGAAENDGSDPTDENGLSVDASGNLYGTTTFGGAGTGCPDRCGTVFRLTPSGSGYAESVLHSFLGADGSQPHAAPVANGGTWFGTTFGGATNAGDCAAGCGVVYKVTP